MEANPMHQAHREEELQQQREQFFGYVRENFEMLTDGYKFGTLKKAVNEFLDFSSGYTAYFGSHRSNLKLQNTRRMKMYWPEC